MNYENKILSQSDFQKFVDINLPIEYYDTTKDFKN